MENKRFKDGSYNNVIISQIDEKSLKGFIKYVYISNINRKNVMQCHIVYILTFREQFKNFSRRMGKRNRKASDITKEAELQKSMHFKVCILYKNI